MIRRAIPIYGATLLTLCVTALPAPRRPGPQGHIRYPVNTEHHQHLRMTVSEVGDVQEAVIRFLSQHYGAKQHYPAYYVGRTPWRDFGRAFMARFRRNTPPVRPLSRVAIWGWRAHDRVTGGRVIAFIIGAPRSVSTDHMMVDARVYWGMQAAYGGTYTVERRGNGWVVSRERIRMQA